MYRKQIIYIKEACKIPGKKYVTMTDVEIEKLIDDLDELAKMALQLAKEKWLASRNAEIGE